MLNAQFQTTSIPSQGVWIVTRFTNIFRDKLHLDYLSTLNIRVCVVSSDPLVHPAVQTHHPSMLTLWDEHCDLPFQCQCLYSNGVELARWTQPQSIHQFAQSSTARRRFCLRFGVNGMRCVLRWDTATIWNSLSPLTLRDESAVINHILWWALVPNKELENLIIDTAQNSC